MRKLLRHLCLIMGLLAFASCSQGTQKNAQGLQTSISELQELITIKGKAIDLDSEDPVDFDRVEKLCTEIEQSGYESLTAPELAVLSYGYFMAAGKYINDFDKAEEYTERAKKYWQEAKDKDATLAEEKMDELSSYGKQILDNMLKND